MLFFQVATEQRPDSDVERSNISHRHFIDILEKAFGALGGKTWLQSHDYTAQHDEESLDDLILANSFATLALGADVVDEDSDAESDEQKVSIFNIPISNHKMLALLTHGQGSHPATYSPQRSRQR